jgi:hypothetical protein
LKFQHEDARERPLGAILVDFSFAEQETVRQALRAQITD